MILTDKHISFKFYTSGYFSVSILFAAEPEEAFGGENGRIWIFSGGRRGRIAPRGRSAPPRAAGYMIE
jgi:hypothetical protein